MKCKDPVLCYTDGVTSKYRHFSLANPFFRSIANAKFDCGKCEVCRKKRARELATRCVLHSSLYRNNCFLTCTYDEKAPGYHNIFNYPDIQKFKKLLRQQVNTVEYCHINTRKLKRRRVPKSLYKKIEIFNVHEYGKNGKKHWHLVIFGYDFPDKVFKFSKNGNRLYTSEILTKLWPHGLHTIGNVTEASAMYQAQYTQKDFQYNHAGTSKKSHSRHSGIGKPYFLKHYKQILQLGYIPHQGKQVPIPRYFERLAHKHWSHFFCTINFVDTDKRKRLYTPFKEGEANKQIADLYAIYTTQKELNLQQSTAEWEALFEEYIWDWDLEKKPDFAKSGENYLYDLRNKLINENAI